MKPIRRTEFDDKSIQATSPLHGIELMEKSIPGMGPLCSTGSAKTMVPAAIPRGRRGGVSRGDTNDFQRRSELSYITTIITAISA